MNKGCRISEIYIAQIGELHDLSIRSSDTNMIHGPNPISHRIAWLLSMCFSMRDPHQIASTAYRFGWNIIPDEIHQENLSCQLSWKNPDFVRMFVARQREFSIRVVVQLNTQLLGWLRKKAIRNPEVIQAIMQQPTCSFRFSIMFDNLYSVASCSYSDIALGEWNIPLSEKPAWVSLLIDHLQGIFCVPYDLDIPNLARKALLSPERHESYHAFCHVLASFGRVRVVEGDDNLPFILIDDDPLALCSQQVQTAVKQACSLHLTGASVVWIDDQLLCETDEQVQVWKICSDGARFGTRSMKKALSWRDKKER